MSKYERPDFIAPHKMIYESATVKLPHKDYHGVKFDLGDDFISDLKLPVELVEMDLRKKKYEGNEDIGTPNTLLEERWYDLYLEKVMKYKHFILSGH